MSFGNLTRRYRLIIMASPVMPNMKTVGFLVSKSYFRSEFVESYNFVNM